MPDAGPPTPSPHPRDAQALPALPPPPRLHVLLAQRARVAAVFRRGPTDWCHVLRWDTATGAVAPGVWLRARVYADSGDISGSGEFISTTLLKGGQGYHVISKLPWLHPLHSAKCEIGPDGAPWRFVPPDGPKVGWEERIPLPGGRGVMRLSQAAPPARMPALTPEDGLPEGAQWGAINHDGRMLLATADGKLEILGGAPGRWRVDSSFDCAPLTPDPKPPPNWAKKW